MNIGILYLKLIRTHCTSYSKTFIFRTFSIISMYKYNITNKYGLPST